MLSEVISNSHHPLTRGIYFGPVFSDVLNPPFKRLTIAMSTRHDALSGDSRASGSYTAVPDPVRG